MRILPLLFVFFSCQQNTIEACKLYPQGFNALLFLERLDDNWDCPTDIALYAHTTDVGGFVNATTNASEQHVHYQGECKTVGVAHLDGYDLRALESLPQVKVAYTIYMHEPPHGMAVVRVNELCDAGEYGVYVGVRP